MTEPSEQPDPEMAEKKVNIGGQQVPMSEVSLHVMNLLESPKKIGSFTEAIIISEAEFENTFSCSETPKRLTPNRSTVL